MTVLVYSIFEHDKAAAKAVDELVEADFTRKHICVLLREGRQEATVSELPVHVQSKVAPGVLVGTALGAVGGALVATSGGLLAAGPILALLQGTVGGGAAGLFAGFVGGLGRMQVQFSKPHGDLPHELLLVGVMASAQGRIKAAEQALSKAGASDVCVRSQSEAMRQLEGSNPDAGLEGPYGMG